MDKPELENITKLYENLTYFDQYGGSVILFIIITIIVIRRHCVDVTNCTINKKKKFDLI